MDSIRKQPIPLYIFTHHNIIFPYTLQIGKPYFFLELPDKNTTHFSFPLCPLYTSGLCHPSFSHINNITQRAGLQIMKLLIVLFLPLCCMSTPCTPNIFLHCAKSKQSDKLPSAYTDILAQTLALLMSVRMIHFSMCHMAYMKNSNLVAILFSLLMRASDEPQ